MDEISHIPFRKRFNAVKHAAASILDFFKSRSSGRNREFTAEALEPRILYSAAPAPLEITVEEIRAEHVESKTDSDFESIEAFRPNTLSPVDKTEGGESETVFLTSFERLTPSEIQELAHVAVEHWKGVKLEPEQRDTLAAIEASLSDIVSLADGSTVFDNDDIEEEFGDASYDNYFAGEDIPEYTQSASTAPLETEQFGIELIIDLLHEIGKPNVLEKLAAKQIAQRTVEVDAVHHPAIYSTLDLMVASDDDQSESLPVMIL